MKKDLFFINEILNTTDNEENIVTLFKVSKHEHENRLNNVESEILKIDKGKLLDLDIKEGTFVYIEKKDNRLINAINASDDEIAKREISINDSYRENLIEKYTSPIDDIDKINIDEVYSYHINVGHGNCSVIVFKTNKIYKIWVVDCSTFDTTNKVNYQKNVKKCLDYIKDKFKLENIEIDKLFVTHPHYDHFNGISYLINQDYLKNTEVWINLYYSWPDSKYNLLLEKFKELKLRLVEPRVRNRYRNSNSVIEVLYPSKTIVRTKSEIVKMHSSSDIAPGGKINNSSAIFKINLGGKSIVFPGDIEEEGWNNVKCCGPYLRNSTFYCISHHGSITGHRRKKCPESMSIKDVGLCCSDKNINILMGRNEAYPGIYNEDVLKEFEGRVYPTDLSLTNEIPYFIELDWQSEEVSYCNEEQSLDEVAVTKEYKVNNK